MMGWRQPVQGTHKLLRTTAKTAARGLTRPSQPWFYLCVSSSLRIFVAAQPYLVAKECCKSQATAQSGNDAEFTPVRQSLCLKTNKGLFENKQFDQRSGSKLCSICGTRGSSALEVRCTLSVWRKSSKCHTWSEATRCCVTLTGAESEEKASWCVDCTGKIKDFA